TYSVRLTVTDDDSAPDTTVRQVVVGAAAAPDLTVSSLTFSPPSPSIGQSLTFSFTIRNLGNASTGLFRVRLQGTSSSTQTYFSALSAGASRSGSLSLPLSASSETFTLTADDLGQISESNEANNTRTVTVTASAPPSPIADAGGPYSGTAGLSITFDGSGSGGSISSYLWYFGDGTTGSGVSPSHAYAASGTYTVTLVVSGSGGQSSDSAQVSVGQAQPALAVHLSLPKPSYQVGESLVITYTTNRTAYVYLCEVTPDGRVILLYPSFFERDNPVAAGSHTVPGGFYTLRVTEPTGGEVLYLFASTQPVPQFPTSFGYGFPTLSTNPGAFRDQVIGTMQSSVPSGDWAFDTLSFEVVPEAPSTGSLQVVTFPSGANVTLDGIPIGAAPLLRDGVSPGYRTIVVSKSGYQTVTRQVGINAGETTTEQITLVAVPPANEPPNAAFNFAPSSPRVGETVQFNGGSSSDPDGTIVAYQWSFGDGGSGTGSLVGHAFATSQTFQVTLTVRDDDGATDSVTQSVVVSPAPTGTLHVLSTPSGADVRLNGAPIGTTPLSRSGVTPGVHTVQISKTGYEIETRQASINASETTTIDVTLTAVPQPDLSVEVSLPKASYHVGEEIVITLTTNRSAYVYVCDVAPDGTVTLVFPNAAEPNNLLPAGTRTVPAQDAGYTLRVSEPIGEERLFTFAATGPIPGFPTTFNGGFPILSTDPGTFRDDTLQTMNGQFASGEWDFDTLSFDVTLPPPNSAPVAQFASFSRAVPIGRGQIFRPSADASYDSDGTIVRWVWDFGDGTTEEGRRPQHRYASEGQFTLRLTV
ncbi:PKD domain-containing protein, partial [Candidatus Bipolaricaulota bacterium]